MHTLSDPSNLPPPFSVPAIDRTESVTVHAQWLREQAGHYKGQWVALRGGALIDHDPSFRALYLRVHQRPDARSLLILQIPADEKP